MGQLLRIISIIDVIFREEEPADCSSSPRQTKTTSLFPKEEDSGPWPNRPKK
jgi:hypothetical protein